MIAFSAKDLSVGYNGRVLIHDINISLEQGKILTLIGPNGAGKSTILKSITRQLATIAGQTCYEGRELERWSAKDFAKQAAVVLTERIDPELMSCAEVVAMGRYPYTNLFGRLTPEDEAIVHAALRRVNAEALAEREFSTLSDGQRQRIMLARAICQQPKIILLDEPTAYLDIRHKIELLGILREMARDEGITVIMSLHEIDLAFKVSDHLLCVKGDTIAAYGTPEEVLASRTVEELYDISQGSYDPLFGSVELCRPEGAPKVFVIAGAGTGTAVFRRLQKEGIPFAAGILYENDVDYRAAVALSENVVSCPAFQPMEEAQLAAATELMLRCDYVIDTGAPQGAYNEPNRRLRALAEARGLLRQD